MTGTCGLDVTHHPSPNHGERRTGLTPDILLLHYTDMERADQAVAWLCNPDANVSCHYLVDVDGTIVQMVEENRRAWHAGRSFWAGETDINSRSIGIEIHNLGHDGGYPDFPEAQMAAVEALCADIVARHSIAARLVLAHSDVAPERKQDPGEKFDWARLHRAGVGHWVEPVPSGEDPGLGVGDEGAEVRELQNALAVYGYRIEATGAFDEQTRLVVTAFQRHFRQERVDGRADRSTLQTLSALCSLIESV